jgi:hypothetical protein
MSLILDKGDVTALVAGIEATFKTKPSGVKTRAGQYGAYSTICVGKNGADYVLTNFKMQFDLLKEVFDDCQYNTLGIEATNSHLYVLKAPPKPPSATPKAASRSKDSTVYSVKKSTGAKAFMGKRYRFKVPAAKAAQLYKNGFKPASARSEATMLFPYIATNTQVACWFSTHQTPGGVANVVRLVSEKGSGIFVPATLTTATHDLNLGSFDLATKARLDSTKKGAELETP